ncbi:MAG: alpha/beta hydrolase [Calditrichaeota bacterium]|nr:MAG: alpha/beta hydrolase [Calditrichota bacterium]MBL1207930.1 alpha/beta hydrolase [Calditrichota bacterium]NOG47765.1 alpha/beta hydrolase [Calditrichota bacterium]
MRILFLSLLFVSISSANPETIQFESQDGLLITADYYLQAENAPLIILFHQAGWSRGEYKEIAPKLNEMGFNCLAIDQRSGNEVNEVINETNQRAKEAGKNTEYIDAFQDMQAALDYATTNLKPNKLFIWGSSYSAALSFVLTATNQNKITAMLAFAPGEYFKKAGKPSDYISTHAALVKVPVFITSAKDEHKNWKAIYKALPSKDKANFLPKTDGQHGSRALWEKFPEHKDYWAAVTKFLKAVKYK